jgi:hypothetical protein
MKQSCGRTTLQTVTEGPKKGLIINHLNTSFKQGLIAHDSHASIKLELTRLGLCIHVPTAPHGALHTAKGMSIVVSHLRSIDSRLYRTCPMVLCHVRRCRSCIPLYNAIVYQGDDRQTSVGMTPRRPDAKIVIHNVGPLFQDMGAVDPPASHLVPMTPADLIRALAKSG